MLYSSRELLAKQGLEPKLLYCGVIGDGGAAYGDLKMVIMEYLKGPSVAEVFDAKQADRGIANDVKRATGLLHNNGMVFDDLRRPNVMVIEDADGHRSSLILIGQAR